MQIFNAYIMLLWLNQKSTNINSITDRTEKQTNQSQSSLMKYKVTQPRNVSKIDQRHFDIIFILFYIPFLIVYYKLSNLISLADVYLRVSTSSDYKKSIKSFRSKITKANPYQPN